MAYTLYPMSKKAVRRNNSLADNQRRSCMMFAQSAKWPNTVMTVGRYVERKREKEGEERKEGEVIKIKMRVKY